MLGKIIIIHFFTLFVSFISITQIDVWNIAVYISSGGSRASDSVES